MGSVKVPPHVQNFAPIPIPVTLPQTLFIQSGVHITIVSNSHLLREALNLLLQNHWPIDVTSSNPGDITTPSTLTQPLSYLVLLDSGIGHDLVLAHIRERRALQPSSYIVVLELKDDPDLILDCIEAGAHGYALQGASSADVMQVIEQVCRGVAQCSPEITAKLFDRLTRSKTSQPASEKPALTRRELEVLHCIAEDYSDRDIATELVIEVRTVKHHVHNILRKLNVKYRRDAAQLAINNGWLNPNGAEISSI